MRVRGLIIALLFTTAPAVHAQSAGTFEAAAFGRFTRFDNTLPIQEEIGGGGSLGFYLIRNLAIEAEGAFTSTHDNFSGVRVSNIPLRGRLTYHFPLGGYSSAFRVGAGYVRNLYRKDINFDDNGATAIAGIRWGLSPSYGFRVDATADYVGGPEGNRTDKYINWGAQVGLSIRVGKPPAEPREPPEPREPREPREPNRDGDNDKDGVFDNVDRCPNTPEGKAVDAGGCAASQLDSDRDRVNDEADRCPNTPSSEAVNAEGCSTSQKDADNDGVMDTADRCLNTPAGERADAEGCSDSQKDGDRDGVMNIADRCPDTPPGEQVDPAGCPVGGRDSDKDGVADGMDQCPGSPMGEPVNQRGCPRDTDSDGVPDLRDRCPSTPVGQHIDQAGCPILFEAGARKPDGGPGDSDNDGVVDTIDQCPGTPAGDPVNPRGCPRDTDTDGVPDGRDKCLHTPVGQPIDETGCPILFEKGARKVVLRGVTFRTGKAMLTPEARDVLRDIATQLVENPEYRVQVSGHTDNTGSRAMNLRLSIARARTVETFLEANGVPRIQITSKGFGPDVPIASNKTAAGRGQNRRVELHRTN
jgi:outer membrane protein OmpA-like peptidoglycan-associated protein